MELLNEDIFDAKSTIEALEGEDWPGEVDYNFGRMIGRFNGALDNIEEKRDRWIALGSLHPDKYEEYQASITDMLERGGFESGPFGAIELSPEIEGTLAPAVLADLVTLGLITE